MVEDTAFTSQFMTTVTCRVCTYRTSTVVHRGERSLSQNIEEPGGGSQNRDFNLFWKE